MDIAITISNRELTPAVVNFFQYENQTVTLNFTLDSYMYGEVDLRNYKAYGVTSQNGMIDMTELVMNYDKTADKLVLSWEVQEYSLRQEGAITYQICFKENADDGENTAVFYSYKGIMINRGSVDGDNHITANYPTILKQWLDKIQELAGTLEAGIVYIPYGESIPSTERLAGRVYFQFTDSANTEGRFEDYEGNELNLSAYLPLSGGKMSGSIIFSDNGMLRESGTVGKDRSLTMFGNNDNFKGSILKLAKVDNTDAIGDFTLQAGDGNNAIGLNGKPNGSLTWNGKNVVRSVNNTEANQSGNVSVDVGVSSVNGKKGDLTPADTGCLPATGGKLTGELDLTSRPLKNVNNIELVPKSNENHGGFIDFHYNGSTVDYTSRIIESAEGRIEVTAPNGIRCNSKYLVRSVDGVTADSGGNVVSNAVKLTGNQVIEGQKAFTDFLSQISGVSNTAIITKNTNIESGVAPSENQIRAFRFSDKNNKILGDLRLQCLTDGRNIVQVNARQYIESLNNEVNGTISVTVHPDGTISSYAPTPPTSDNSTQIATTAWCHSNMLPKTGGTLSGNITFSQNNGYILSNGSSGQVGIQQGTSTENGASLWLYGNSNSGSGKASIQVYDKNAGTYRALDICPDGSLTWQGKDVVTENLLTGAIDLNGGYFPLPNNVLVQFGKVNTSSSTNVNLPQPFANKNYIVVISGYTEGSTASKNYASAYNLTTTSFTVAPQATGAFAWIAIGMK